MKSAIFFFALILSVQLAAQNKVNFDSITNRIQNKYPTYTYIFEVDEDGNKDWLMFWVNSEVQCELYQCLGDHSKAKALLFKPGQEVWIWNDTTYISEKVRIATFDEFRKKECTYPAVILGNSVFYYVKRDELWEYIVESELHTRPQKPVKR